MSGAGSSVDGIMLYSEYILSLRFVLLLSVFNNKLTHWLYSICLYSMRCYVCTCIRCPNLERLGGGY